jgi:hypothetical protein
MQNIQLLYFLLVSDQLNNIIFVCLKCSAGMVPFVLFGPNCNRKKLQKVLQGEKVELSDLPVKTNGTSHMVGIMKFI